MHRILILLLALLATAFAAEQPTSMPGGVAVGRDNPAGTANTAGLVKWWSGGNNAFYTIFQAGTQSASVTYTLPLAVGGAGTALTDVAGNGILSWATPSGGITGALTATRIPVASGASTLTDYSTLTTDGTSLLVNTIKLWRGEGGGGNLGDRCVQLGTVSLAGGTDCTAVGDDARANENHSTSIGAGAWASGTGATALGYQARVGAYANSTSLGAGATATKSNQVILGNSSVTEVFIPGTTDATTPTAAQLYVAGGIGAGRIRTTSPSYFDGALIGSAEISTAGAFHPTAGAAAAASAMSFGVALTEGLQVKVIEETVSFAAAAKYKTLTQTIPAGALILSSAVNIQSTITAGGTSVKVGLGLNGSTPSSYGLAADLVKNSKITNGFLGGTVTPLAAPLTLDVCICETTGAALGNTDATAGTVRVRIVYEESAALVNAP
jgi:hypothetical protein